MKDMINRGELPREEGTRLLDKMLSYSQITRSQASDGADEVSSATTEEAVRRALEQHDVPTRSEIQTLLLQLDDLAGKLDEIEQESLPSAD